MNLFALNNSRGGKASALYASQPLKIFGYLFETSLEDVDNFVDNRFFILSINFKSFVANTPFSKFPFNISSHSSLDLYVYGSSVPPNTSRWQSCL